MPKPAWHILTGEYPPALGGVSDYTRAIARALAAAGDEVHVWAPGAALRADDGIRTHGLPDVFGPRSLIFLSAQLAGDPRPKRILVQYVPHAFGMKGMNLPFCAWLAAHRRDEVWVMFHEVVFPWGRDRPWRHNVLGGVTRVMAGVVANRADRNFVSVPAWDGYLRSLVMGTPSITWLPIPSNIPGEVSPGALARARSTIARESGAHLVGHFGTYGSILAPLLVEVFRRILAVEQPRRLLLLGRGGPAFAHAHFAGERVTAPGSLPGEEIAALLAACDVVVQPFVDGVSSRRTSVMASLALGVPVVTNEGPLSDDVWRNSRAVALATEPTAGAIAAATEALLSDLPAARELGARGKALYDRDFSLQHTIEILRANH